MIELRRDRFCGGATLFGDISNDGGQFWGSAFSVTGEPHVSQKRLSVFAMSMALHRRPKLGSLFQKHSAMQVGQKCTDWLTDQLFVSRHHKLNGGLVCEFYDALLIDRDNRRWTGLHQGAYTFLRR